MITANKALLAHHGTMLAELAETNGVGLMFEAAIAGGIPAVKALREGLVGNSVKRVSGIRTAPATHSDPHGKDR